MSLQPFHSLLVRELPSGGVAAEVELLELSQLPPGEVQIRVAYSCLNYKDALAVSGNRGVARTLPLVPGINAVGEVVASEVEQFSVGQSVFVAHAEFGTKSHGGLSQFARVPAAGVFAVPSGLSERDVAALGTAGFTAANSIDQLQRHGIGPSGGPVLVTGATGGVGMFAVKLLSESGYEVWAVTGKSDRADWLRSIGAKKVLDRNEVSDASSKPLLSGRWAGVVDTVGGQPLADAIRATKPNGCVTACGNVAGAELPLTVFPFILRGVTLCGIDSPSVTRERRESLWQQLADRVAGWDMADWVQEITLPDVPAAAQKMLSGQVTGRIIVNVADA